MVCTSIIIDFRFSKIKDNSKWFAVVSHGAPLVIVEGGKPLKERMKQTRVDENDVLEAARVKHGLERMDQIKYVVFERGGDISIIPFEQ